MLVQGRDRQDIVDAFGASRSDVTAALNSNRTVSYLEGVGYNVRGKTESDLSARETFELLSAREINSADEIVDVLSRLTDRLARDRAERSERESKRRKSGTASIVPNAVPAIPELDQKPTAVFEKVLGRTVDAPSNRPVLSRGSPKTSSTG